MREEEEKKKKKISSPTYLVELLNSQAFWPSRDEQHTSLDIDFIVQKKKKKRSSMFLGMNRILYFALILQKSSSIHATC